MRYEIQVCFGARSKISHKTSARYMIGVCLETSDNINVSVLVRYQVLLSQSAALTAKVVKFVRILKKQV